MIIEMLRPLKESTAFSAGAMLADIATAATSKSDFPVVPSLCMTLGRCPDPLRPTDPDPIRRADPVPNPARAGEQTIVIIALRDQLNADRQIVRPTVGRQCHCRRMQSGPHRLHARIASRSAALRRFAGHAWRQQHVEA